MTHEKKKKKKSVNQIFTIKIKHLQFPSHFLGEKKKKKNRQTFV